MIRITSKHDGFRRCGIAHSKGPTEYPDDRFSKQELKTLQAEPMLVVEIVEEDAKSGSDDKRPNAKESIKLAEAAESLEALEKLAEGEDRKSVLEAIAKRRQELEEK